MAAGGQHLPDIGTDEDLRTIERLDEDEIAELRTKGYKCTFYKEFDEIRLYDNLDIDNISWRAYIEDLEEAYDSSFYGGNLSLLPFTRKLYTYMRYNFFQGELPSIYAVTLSHTSKATSKWWKGGKSKKGRVLTVATPRHFVEFEKHKNIGKFIFDVFNDILSMLDGLVGARIPRPICWLYVCEVCNEQSYDASEQKKCPNCKWHRYYNIYKVKPFNKILIKSSPAPII